MNKLLVTLALTVISSLATAQATIVVSTGGPTGTYSSMFKSIQAKCGDKIQLVEKPSSGSDENLENLVNKQADAAFVQTDTLQFTAMNDPRAGDSSIRVLLPLHPEEVHVIALRDLSKTNGGVTLFGKNVGGTTLQLNSLSDLAGVKVGTWGGSYTTARAISYLGGVKYDVVKFDSSAKAMAALGKGEIGAILAVGGQPVQFVKELGPNFKLLKIDAALASKVKAYTTARLNYRNLGTDGVETVTARAILVVKNYVSPERKANFATLKQCIIANENEFKEGVGHHPKWSDVVFTDPVSWAMYDVGLSPATAVTKKK